jgi:hypothetical protein
MMIAQTLTLDALESVSAKSAAMTNSVYMAVRGQVLNLAGQSCALKLSSDVNQAFSNQVLNHSALKVALRFNGQAIVLGLSESLVNALLAEQQIALADTNVDILHLLIRLKILPYLPQGLEFVDLAITPIGALEAPFDALPEQVSLSAVHAQTSEWFGWCVTVYAMPQTALKAFLKCFEFLVMQTIPSPLLNARIPMPIIAARTAIPANQLNDLAVGDVVIFS